jgi:hypothetical protein
LLFLKLLFLIFDIFIYQVVNNVDIIVNGVVASTFAEPDSQGNPFANLDISTQITINAYSTAPLQMIYRVMGASFMVWWMDGNPVHAEKVNILHAWFINVFIPLFVAGLVLAAAVQVMLGLAKPLLAKAKTD